MTIVVGLTPTPEGNAALDAAIMEARRRDTDLLLVNTTRGDSVVDPAFVPDDALAALQLRLTDDGIRHRVHQVVAHREPAEEILAVADDASAELIVIGMRRRTPVGKLLLGSTSQRVLLEADVPVLTVKPVTSHAHGHHWWQWGSAVR